MINSNEMITMSEAQMLALWRRTLHLDVARRECVLERDDGIDQDDYLLDKVRQWYAHLLATAQAELLPIEEVGADVTLAVSSDGVVTATLPPRCVRAVEWQLAGWEHSVTWFPQPELPAAQLQLNPWTRGGTCNPAAVDHGDRLMLYSLPTGVSPVLTMARCVVRPADGTYVLHRSLLDTIPEFKVID